MFATPNTLTAKTRCQSSEVDETTSPTAPTPALLQSTSIRPRSRDDLVDGGRAMVGLRDVETVEEVEADHPVAVSRKSLDHRRTDAALGTCDDNDPLGHELPPEARAF